MEPNKSFQTVKRGGTISILLGVAFAAISVVFLPEVPLGEWSWIIRGGASIFIGAIVFGIAWFLTVVRAMAEM